MKKTLSIVTLCLLAVTASGGAAAQVVESYAQSLARVYDHTLWIRSIKEGCDTAHKETASANSAAYNSWRRRNKPLLDELENRLTAMIRRTSTDEKDYAKNMGKSLGEVTQHREVLKQNFLGGPPDDVQRQCKLFAEALRGDEGDLEKRFAEELKTIRKRKL